MLGFLYKWIYLVLIIHNWKVNGADPVFLTTLDDYEAGTWVLGTTNPLTNNGYSSESTSVSYENIYTSPSIGLGLGYLNSIYDNTLTYHVYAYDLTITSTGSTSAEILLNCSQSTIQQISVNYIITEGGFFLDIAHTYFDLQAQTVYTSTSSSSRTAVLSIGYQTKSNSTNAAVIYSAIGMEIIRNQTHTFEYSITTSSLDSNSFNVSLMVEGNNRMRWIRLCSFSYQKVATTIDPPYYLDMGFLTGLSNTVTDASGITISELGVIFTGMVNWLIDDSNSVLDYNLAFASKTYTITTNALSSARVTYFWYRMESCDEYHYLSGHICEQCHYSCLTCTNSDNTSCLTCPTTRIYNSNENSCECITDYTDVGVSLCVQVTCSATCETCANLDQCGSCNQATFNRYLSGTECICAEYTYDSFDVDSQVFCFPCHYSCLSCSSKTISATACLSCSYDRDHRQYRSANNSCDCIDGYFDDGASVCTSCQHSCATCTNQSKCVSCNASLGREMDVGTQLCSCVDGTYDGGLIEECVQCPHNCETCSSGSVCLTCPSTRELSNDDCVCIDGYYDDGISLQCQECNYTCATCSDTTECTSCNATLQRYMLDGECLCASRYYDDDPNEECLICYFACIACSDSLQTSCTACDAAKYRQLSQDNRCVCMDGFYQVDKSTQLCDSCEYSCQTCTSSLTCDSCDGAKHRSLDGDACICTDGYYDDGNQECETCFYRCLTCSSSAACDTCDNSTRNTADLSVCECLDGYYDDGINNYCLPCLGKCLTCDNGNNCTSCESNKVLSATQDCVCASGTYQPSCLACSYECEECSGTANNCVKCDGNAFRYLNSTLGTCLCYDGYFSDGVSEECKKCHYSCETCTHYDSCTTCPSNRVSNGTYCSCLQQFYEHSSNLNCLACHYSCAQCNDHSICTLCDAAKYRQLASGSTLCSCIDGYYDSGAELCYQCLYSCATCSNYDVCTSCNSSQWRYIDNNDCLCMDTFYEHSATLQCTSCHYSCSTCDDGISCLSCPDDRYLHNDLCECDLGTYEDPITLTCELCQYPCEGCVNDSTTCTSCGPTHTLQVDICSCDDGTFENTTECQSCLDTCGSCSDASTCDSCKSGTNRQLTNHICDCETGYHDENDSELVCIQCDYTCLQCSDSSSCDSCQDIRVLVNGSCLCPSTLYFDDGSSPTCIPCSYQCLSCESTSTNCTDCSSAAHRYLSGDSCVCQNGYYDNGATVCASCHYSCQQCTDDTSCDSCNSTLGRVYISGPYCECEISYYDISSQQQCESCHYSCQSCEITESRCLSCPSTRLYNNASYTCDCEQQLFDDGSSPTCESCAYHCLTCSDSLSCDTCPSSRLLNSSSLCTCINNYYDSGALQCQECYQLCLECSNYDVCTECDSSLRRTLVDGVCTCQMGYWDTYQNNTNITCEACHYSCQYCASDTQCTGCNSVSYRIYDTSTKLCKCRDGFYDDGVNEQCSPCPFDCDTCSSATECLSCTAERQLNVSTSRCDCKASYYINGSKCEQCPPQCSECTDYDTCTNCNGNRTLDSGSCICPDFQYSVTNSFECADCLYSCETCKSGAQCLTCDANAYRYLSNHQCVCQSSYFDDGTNELCVDCHYSCLTCDAQDSCLKCSSSQNRVYNYTSLLCDCAEGYYEDNSTLFCVQCHYTCISCADGDSCIECNSLYKRTLVDGQCQCTGVGYYDDGISMVCGVCEPYCYQCTSASNQCTSCDASTNRQLDIDNCTCIDGYFEYNQQLTCVQCSYKCVTCEGTSTTCTLCSSSDYRTATPDCACEVGMYDNGIDSACVPCDYRCLTCINSVECATCNSTIGRYMSNASICECEQYSYDDGSNSECVSCHYTCSTCNHPTICMTCPSTRTYDTGKCDCNVKYYDAGVLECIACDYRCEDCDNASQCSSCASSSNRQFNINTKVCDCLIGYYDTQQSEEECEKCDSSCYTCTNSTHCASCVPSSNKTINTNYCECLYAHYQTTSNVCEPCHYSCQQCETSSIHCIECDNNSNRYLTQANECLCENYYYDNGADETCIQCYGECVSCYGDEVGECLQCQSDRYILNGECYSECPDYYYEDDATSSCLICSSYCIECDSSDTCILCQDAFYLYSPNDDGLYSCVDQCPQFYYHNTTQCMECISPCYHCTAEYECIDCIEGYYEDTYCYPCHSSCKYCSGASAKKCISCVSGYTLDKTTQLCTKISCGATQYVDSTNGCTSCSDTFPSAIECTADGVTTCDSGYILSDSTCVLCSDVSGYELVNGQCSDLCGDGIRIDDGCDDGNVLDGDGCSSVCQVEDNWECGTQCTLLIEPVLELTKIEKVSGSNTIIVVVSLNVGLRLVKQNFILSFSNDAKHTFTLSSSESYTQYSLQISYEASVANSQLQIGIRNPPTKRRLLSDLSLSLDLDISIDVITEPPAIYYEPSIRTAFQTPIFIVLIILHVGILVGCVVVMGFGWKLMLVVIDCCQYFTLLYLHTTIGLFGTLQMVSLSCQSLQPFIYSFGTPLAQPLLATFSYTHLILSILLIQFLTLLVFYLVSLHSKHFYYYYLSFMFCFYFQLVFCVVVVCAYIPIHGFEGAYSWAIMIVLMVLCVMETWLYYQLVASMVRKDIVPLQVVSYQTKESKNDDVDPFAEEEEKSESKEDSENKTDVEKQQIAPKVHLNLHDLLPNTLPPSYFPVQLILAFLIAIALQLYDPIARISFLLAIQLSHFVYLCVRRSSPPRFYILFIKCFILIIICVFGLVSAITNNSGQAEFSNLYAEIVVIVLVFIAVILNGIGVILGVVKSEDYKEYMIQKKNQEIIEKNARKNRLKGISISRSPIKNIFARPAHQGKSVQELSQGYTENNLKTLEKPSLSKLQIIDIQGEEEFPEKVQAYQPKSKLMKKQPTSRTQSVPLQFNQPARKKKFSQSFNEKHLSREQSREEPSNQLKSTRVQENTSRNQIKQNNRFFASLENELVKQKVIKLNDTLSQKQMIKQNSLPQKESPVQEEQSINSDEIQQIELAEKVDLDKNNSEKTEQIIQKDNKVKMIGEKDKHYQYQRRKKIQKVKNPSTIKWYQEQQMFSQVPSGIKSIQQYETSEIEQNQKRKQQIKKGRQVKEEKKKKVDAKQKGFEGEKTKKVKRKIKKQRKVQEFSSMGEDTEQYFVKQKKKNLKKDGVDDGLSSEEESVTVFKKILHDYQIYQNKRIRKDVLKKKNK